MKKLVALAGLIALGLAGVAEAARPAGAGKPGGGSPTPSVTYVESPLVEVGVEDGVKVWSEVAGSSVRISSLGHWVVETTIGGETYDVCLDAELPPANVNTPLLLESNVAAGVGGFSADGDIGVSNQGYWLGPTFQIYPGGTSSLHHLI